MKNNKYFLNTVLAAVMGLTMAVCVIVRVFAPWAIFPPLNIPNMVLISVIALVIDSYIAKGAPRCPVCILLLGGVTFGLLPYAAGFATDIEAVKLAITGGVTFGVTTALYTSIQERLSSGPKMALVPIFSAFGLYLAAQCFVGIVL